MIALLLGLVVTAAAIGMLLANKRVYASTETLNRIQENTRVSFEIMSRDLREAGGNPCGGAIPIISQLESGDNGWWAQYADGLYGYDSEAAPGTTTGSAVGQRVANTDAIDLHMANNGDIRVTQHDNPSAVLDVTGTSGISDGNILMVCNNSFAMVFQATGITGSGVKIGHNGGSGGNGNCGNEFQYERNCTGGASGDKGYCFLVPEDKSVNPNCAKHSRSPATVVQVQSFRWYIGNNGRGPSLYRATLVNQGATTIPTAIDTVEIAEGVSDMSLRYRTNGAASFVDAATITLAGTWGAVNAVQVILTVDGAEGALSGAYIEGTDGNALSRQLTHIVAIRNKEGVL